MSLRESWPTARMPLGVLVVRLRSSAVAWTWLFHGLRLASGLLLLPLVLNFLSKPEVGMYYVLLSLAALVPVIDFGFGPTIGRFITYAMGGAQSIQAQGVAELTPEAQSARAAKRPNYKLLWELLVTMRTLYRYLSLVLLVVLGAWGTYTVELGVHQTPSPLLVRLAWGATLLTAVFDIYANWWVVYLRSMNEVLAAAKIALLATVVRLVLAASLLLAGAGLLSLPLGTFVGSLIQRLLARRVCLRLLPTEEAPERVDPRKHLRIIWPNTWRTGVQFLSGYLTVNANMAICLHAFGLSASQVYGLSVQLVTFINGIAAVWTAVKWPLIGQYLAQHDYAGVKRVLRPRVWLQDITFLISCAVLLWAGPFLLAHFGGGKQMMSANWVMLLMLNSFLEMQFIIWGTVLFTENCMIYLWPTVATNVLSLALSLLLVQFTTLGFGGLVLGPLAAGMIFNYWYWPFYVARRLGTSFPRLMFVGVQRPA